MKYIWFYQLSLSALFCIISAVANSQSHSIALSGGPNITNVNWDNWYSKKQRTGFSVESIYEYQTKNHWVFGAGINFQQRGYIVEDSEIISDLEKYDYSYSYIGLSMKGGYVLGEKVKVIGCIGLLPAYLVNGTLKVHGAPDLPDLDFTEGPGRFDFAGIIDLTVSMPVNKSFRIDLGTNFQHSITSYTQEGYFEGTNARHYGVSFQIGFRYTI